MPKGRRIAGWVLSGLLAAVFISSSMGKFLGATTVVKQLADLGVKDQIILIGAGELIGVILFLVPRTHPLGVLLLSSYMGGAILAHMSHGESYIAQSVILLLIWTAGFLRRPWLFVDPPAVPSA